jgi:hypothetical protein
MGIRAGIVFVALLGFGTLKLLAETPILFDAKKPAARGVLLEKAKAKAHKKAESKKEQEETNINEESNMDVIEEADSDEVEFDEE